MVTGAEELSGETVLLFEVTLADYVLFVSIDTSPIRFFVIFSSSFFSILSANFWVTFCIIFDSNVDNEDCYAATFVVNAVCAYNWFDWITSFLTDIEFSGRSWAALSKVMACCYKASYLCYCNSFCWIYFANACFSLSVNGTPVASSVKLAVWVDYYNGI